MKFDPQKYARRSTRLQGYNCAQAGAYFVTIATQGREYLFASDESLNQIRQYIAENPPRWTEDEENPANV